MGFFTKYLAFRVITRKSPPPDFSQKVKVYTTAEIVANRHTDGLTATWVRARDAQRLVDGLRVMLTDLKTTVERLQGKR